MSSARAAMRPVSSSSPLKGVVARPLIVACTSSMRSSRSGEATEMSAAATAASEAAAVTAGPTGTWPSS
jgi:hypothetical protein